ncbi:lipase/acyltransferase domain-containing protein [Polynucleobacter necessarius]|uniref:lipase/acyltransferase domain-containing protein n=1 Tax=Polynucleobacter necessarius TaxID=576610 RepID=UPI000E094C7F|nr:hypothetical protein [Polynucleobacter necessarius]
MAVNLLKIYLIVFLCQISFNAHGQVFDIAHHQDPPTRTLLISAQNLKALVLLFPGGGGLLRLQEDGGTKNRHTFVRSMNLWAQYQIDAVLVDTPYDLGDLRRGNLRERKDHLSRVGEVVQYYKNKTNLPVWIFGHSMGTSTATYFASQLNISSKLLSGIIIAGTIQPASLDERVNLPVPGIHHLEDACAGTSLSATRRILEGRPKEFVSKLEIIEGGASEGNVCDSFAYHGFNQTEPELIKRAAEFILSN